MAHDLRKLRPAEHVKPAPADGYRGRDLTPDELVDDEFIAADPDSHVVTEDERDLMALTFADLVHCARRTGVENWPGGKVVSAPSSWRGKRGTMGTVVGVTRHHTGTPETFKATEDYPTYQVVKEGRPGLDNSLSAYGLGRHSGIYVFSECLSWHAGAWSYAGITDGNGHFLGIEAEGTGASWTAFQREFYPRLCASVLMFVGEGVGMMPRHADGAMPRGRKTDAGNLPADFTAKVAGYLANPATLTYGASEDDLPTSQELIAALLATQLNSDTGNVKQTIVDARKIARRAEQAALDTKAEVAALRALIEERLPAAPPAA